MSGASQQGDSGLAMAPHSLAYNTGYKFISKVELSTNTFFLGRENLSLSPITAAVDE